MVIDLIKRLAGASEEPMPALDARLALAALLVRIGRADGDFSDDEAQRVRAVLADRYSLQGAELDALMTEAQALETDAPDTVRFTKAIKGGVPYEERLGVIEAMWSVVLADGGRDDEENALMRMVAPMLGVNDRDSNMARQRAEG